MNATWHWSAEINCSFLSRSPLSNLVSIVLVHHEYVNGLFVFLGSVWDEINLWLEWIYLLTVKYPESSLTWVTAAALHRWRSEKNNRPLEQTQVLFQVLVNVYTESVNWTNKALSCGSNGGEVIHWNHLEMIHSCVTISSEKLPTRKGVFCWPMGGKERTVQTVTAPIR